MKQKLKTVVWQPFGGAENLLSYTFESCTGGLQIKLSKARFTG